MKTIKQLVIASSICCINSIYGAGFGLYQASTAGSALGGAVVGRAVDASANFYNPATLTDLTNITVTAGFVTEHPRARMKVDGASSSPMDPGLFWLPHFGVVVPLPADFSFGFICLPEYGLGSAYDDNWELVNSSQETTVMSFTLNPNVAYKITDDWSVAAGLRWIFFDFEQYSQPMPGKVYNRLWGDNRAADLGWQIGTKYDVLDNFSVGAVYKSKTLVHVEGKSDLDGLKNSSVPAETVLEMPDSVTVGFNWDITDTWHLGGAATWTQWSTLGTLDFNLGGQHTPCVLEWEDTYRFALAPSWDFAEDWTWMGSYAYETDCTGDQLSTMLPKAERHMLTTGVAWRAWKGLELALSYGLIIMDGHGGSRALDSERHIRTYQAYRGLSHAVGFSITYRF